jgi:hypothetical protein
MSIYYPYEVFVGSDIVEFSFTLPDALVSIFTEEDRLPILSEDAHDEDYSPDYQYETTVRVILDRLEIMGYTSARWRDELESFRQLRIEEIAERIAEDEDWGHTTHKATRMAVVLKQAEPKRWVKTLLAMMTDQWGWSPREPRSWVLEKALTDGDYGPILTPFGDSRSFMRAVTDLHGDAETVCFRFGDAVGDEHIDPATPFTDLARSNLLEGTRGIEKVIVLTEGRSDSRILQRSLARLYPHLRHMYSFLDHSAFKAQGGTGDLERLARGFAGAGIANRTVVLFDNDTAGVAAAQRLRQIELPGNFRVETLPDLDFAQSYPTIGPTGPALANVNGSACGIELYCGRTALTGEDGQTCPIQWTGYDTVMKRYQGEPMEKEKIKERFFRVLDHSSGSPNDPEFTSIRLILQSLMRIQW